MVRPSRILPDSWQSYCEWSSPRLICHTCDHQSDHAVSHTEHTASHNTGSEPRTNTTMGCLLLRHTHEVYSLQLPTTDTCWKRSSIDWGQSLSLMLELIQRICSWPTTELLGCAQCKVSAGQLLSLFPCSTFRKWVLAPCSPAGDWGHVGEDRALATWPLVKLDCA